MADDLNSELGSHGKTLVEIGLKQFRETSPTITALDVKHGISKDQINEELQEDEVSDNHHSYPKLCIYTVTPLLSGLFTYPDTCLGTNYN